MLLERNELGIYLGIDATDLDPGSLSRFDNAILLSQGIFEQLIGYRIEGEEEVFFDGEGNTTLWLPYFPVDEITSLKYYDDVLYQWTSYPLEFVRVNSKTGELSLSSNYSPNSASLLQDTFPRGFQNVKCDFKFGYGNIDDDDPRYPNLISIKFALSEIAALVYRHAGELSFQTIDDGVQKARYDFNGTTFVQMLSPEVVNIIHSFAKRGVAR
jgi:hypothetical protein